MTAYGPTALLWENYAIGDNFTTQGRTIGEAENTFWTMFSGDMNPMHVDDEYAQKFGLFGGRFPAGLMIVAVASGLMERMGLFTGTGLAMTGQSVNYHKAVLINDTVHVQMIVKDLAPSKRKPAGRVTFDYEIINQHDDVCASGEITYFIRSHTVNTDQS